MNIKLIVFSGLMTCVAGVVLGIALAEINRADHRPEAPQQYAAMGAGLGLVIGSGQEALRQLRRRSEEI